MRAEVRYPVSLLLNRSQQQTGQWRYPSWTVVSVLPAGSEDTVSSPGFMQVHTSDNSQDFLWQGLWLELFHDGLQAYYENLTGSQPSLFVLCHERDEEPGMSPICISASLADAEAHMEIDGTVLVTALEAPFSGWLANYVLQNRDVFEHQLSRLHHEKKGKHRHA